MANSDTPEAGIGHNSESDHANDQIRSYIERIERLEEEKKTIADDIKDVYGEAKGNGFDVKVLRKVVARRKRDRDDLANEDAMVELYEGVFN